MTFIDRYDGCTMQIADVTCCFLLRNFYTIFMEKVSFYHALMSKNCRQSFAFNEKGPFNARFPSSHRPPRALCFPIIGRVSGVSQPVCIPRLSSVKFFLICAKFFHTRLSTVNHRRPFSDFY